MNELKELYQQVIIDHGHSPRNFGVLENSNKQSKGFNPVCGDRLTIYLKVEDDTIKAVQFEGQGCAISMASASLMTEMINGMSTAQALELFNNFHKMVVCENADEKNIEKIGKLSVLRGVRAYPSRVKCATLAWHTLSAALSSTDNATVSTE
ncbi:MAG: SUF system NifU family Fe-S cluster assembly protein [Thiotrichales bacterium]|nr:MAG: SUF system NifU family Fe-S cluster assembly protein [Thiotrichales bacterium]